MIKVDKALHYSVGYNKNCVASKTTFTNQTRNDTTEVYILKRRKCKVHIMHIESANQLVINFSMLVRKESVVNEHETIPIPNYSH
jgi:hypothetical protein